MDAASAERSTLTHWHVCCDKSSFDGLLSRGPLFVSSRCSQLIAISRTSESTPLLLHQLSYAYLQMVSVLTCSVTSILENKPSYDIRNLMQGTEAMLADLMDEADCSPYLIFGLLIGGGKQLIHIVRGRDRILHPSDCLLLLNFLTNSLSLRSSEESWTPICLPHFSNRGFLYAYICYLTDDICLTLLTADSGDFANLRLAKTKIVEGQCARSLETDGGGMLFHFLSSVLC
jgi:hypothetical protein